MIDLNEQFISLNDVIQKTSLSRSSIYELMGKGEFPAPVPIRSRKRAWLLSEVTSWMQARLIERDRHPETPRAAMP